MNGARAGKRKLLALGDSLAQGYAAFSQRDWNSAGWEVQNEAVCGSGLLSQRPWDWSSSGAAQIKAAKPDAVVISMGTNDLGKPARLSNGFEAQFGTVLWFEIWKEKMAPMLQAAKEAGARVAFMPMPPFGQPKLEAQAAQVRDLQKSWMESQGAFVPDLGKKEFSPAGRAADGIHFTAQGYRERMLLAAGQWDAAAGMAAQASPEVRAKLAARRQAPQAGLGGEALKHPQA